MATKKKPSIDIAALAAADDEDVGLDDAGMGGDMEAASGMGDDYDLDSDVFASEMAVAFPEIAEDPARLDAFKAAIEACVKATREV